MGLHLDERPDGGFALYIDGDFQFDTADEAIYHESLALPALCLARAKKPQAIRVLICGGGDGLALRECLRFPGVASVDLVDYDPAIIDLARARFSEINAHAFEDARVRVHIRDAWEFLDSMSDAGQQVKSLPEAEMVNAHTGPNAQEAAPPPRTGLDPTPNTEDLTPLFDVILCDFTVPRTPDQTRIFTREWYARLAEALSPDGVIALNAVSPQTAPEAFWCLHRTVRAAGLSPLPYHVCIPSFRAHGYGAWGFLLAAKRRLTVQQLRTLDCPVTTRQCDVSQLWRGARFRRAERQMEQQVPVQSLHNNCLLPLLLNPGMPTDAAGASDETVPYSLETLLHAIPITHAYHTRVMIETLAEQVVSTVTEIDIRRLVEALLRRAPRLPTALREELLRLRDFLSGTALRWDRLMAWGARLFAALVILMTLANAIAPDNAFAKGSAGLGHAGVSRGFSSSFGKSGSFGAGETGRGGGSFSSAGGGGSRGSFGRTGAFGSRSIFDRSASAPVMQGHGFRTGYGSGHPVDMYGVEYNMAPFRYYYGGTHNYFGGRQNSQPPGPPEEHKALFAADDDLLVMDNGDIVVTLSDLAYLLVTDGKVILRSRQSPDPLIALYPDPAFFETILTQLRERRTGVQQAISARRDWLSWVGWTSAMVPVVAQDKTELIHLQDLDRRLEAAIQRMGQPPAGATPAPPVPVDQTELFVDARLRENGGIVLRQADGKWLVNLGTSIEPEGIPHEKVPSAPCPPALSAALRSVMGKLQKEMAADIASLNHDLTQGISERTTLEHDLTEYTSLQASNGGDPNYQVDYGSDEISVSDAIARTQRDIDQANMEMQQTQRERDKLVADQKRLAAAAPTFRQ